MSISQNEMFKKCDEFGESKVRENLNSNIWNSSKQKHANEWLRQLEANCADIALSRRADREDEAIKIACEANNLARSANSSASEANRIALDAASSARKQARWAVWAATIATIAIIIAAMTYIKTP